MSEVIVPIGIIAVLIALNGLFVAAEFAIVGVSRAELARAGRERRRAVRLARRILRDPRRQDRFIATAQLGITTASLGLGMYGEHIVADWIAVGIDASGVGQWIAAHTLASVLSIAILTYFHIVLGEMVPKSIALQRARSTVLLIAPIMRAIQLAVYPLVIALNGLGNTILRVVGIDRSQAAGQRHTPEEIAYIVQESQAGGLLRKEAADVVRELLEFGDLTAGEVMVPRVRVVGLPFDAGPGSVRAILRKTPHTRYPVYEGTLDNIIGMTHVRDLLRRANAGGATVSRDTVQVVPFVPTTARMDHVLASMRNLRVQMAVVMDEHGGTAGIITMEDLFEEIVGDITEQPGELPEIVEEEPGRALVDGAARIDDVGTALGVVLEHEEVDTVSGLVLAFLGRPPKIGDVVIYDQVRFEVVAVRGHGVGACEAALRPPDA